MNFSGFRDHTNNLFITDKIVKFTDIITNQIMLIHQFNKKSLPTDLHNIFLHSINIHNYNTPISSNHELHIPQVLSANYGLKHEAESIPRYMTNTKNSLFK